MYDLLSYHLKSELPHIRFYLFLFIYFQFWGKMSAHTLNAAHAAFSNSGVGQGVKDHLYNIIPIKLDILKLPHVVIKILVFRGKKTICVFYQSI